MFMRNLLRCTSMFRIAAIVVLLLGMTFGIHGNRHLVPLPDPMETPKMQNQSLMACQGGKYASLSVEFVPKRIVRGEMVAVKGSVTPKSDILYLACKASLKWNGITKFSQVFPDLCDNTRVSCPMLKGKTYVFKSKPIISLLGVLVKGKYHVEALCTDQNNQEIACLIWDFTWL